MSSMGAAVPHDGGAPDPFWHKKTLTPYEEHVLERYFSEQRAEAAEAKKRASAARAHRGVDLPATRDATARFSEPRLDWMTLEFELSAQRIVALDEEKDEWMTYTRKQSSSDQECLWAAEQDLVEPEGHTTEKLMEMWPTGFRVVKRFSHGFEPPHDCSATAACPYCRAINRKQK